MFDRIQYRIRLARMQKRRRWIKSQFRKDLIKARKTNKPHEQILSIYADESHELDIIDSEIGSFVSQNLLDEADRNFLTRPDLNKSENWLSYSVTSISYLSPSAMTDLQERINKKKSETWQFYELRLKVVAGFASAITGVTGALIGLVAIWK